MKFVKTLSTSYLLLAFGMLLSMSIIASAAQAAANIVQDGKANAQIVIAKDRPRMVSLAALELQYYIQKISGAKLPIVFEPANDQQVKIYIGKTPATVKLGVTDEGLRYGAFRIVSSDNALVLLGPDYDHTPPDPWGARPRDEAPMARWDELTKGKTDTKWGFPFHAEYKDWWNPNNFYETMAERYGQENASIYNPHELIWSRTSQEKGGSGFWLQDEGGSLNAVYEFLRMLDVRWYMSGDLGDVIPQTKTIALPKVNLTSKPDFGCRAYTWYNYGGFSFDNMIWARRLGINSSEEVLGSIPAAHGLAVVHKRTEMQEKHPEYFALINGKRDTEHRGMGHECFSSQGLIDETVRYCSFIYDQYNSNHVSLFPVDGYQGCQCELCEGKTASELVWGFVNTVATELYKKYPDRIVSCGAYTPYTWAPETITKFSPNVVVMITNAGRSGFMDEARWESYQQRVGQWYAKLEPGHLFRVENNRFSIGAQIRPNVITFPTLHPRGMDRDFKFLKGKSLGEMGEQSQQRSNWVAMGFDHLNLYVGANLMWNADLNLDNLLNEYYEKFYGPAASQMKDAFTFAEENYTPRIKRVDTSVTAQTRIELLEKLTAARAKAGDSIYGQRIDFILSQYETMDNLKQELKKEIAAGDPRDRAKVLTTKTLTDNGESAVSYELLDNVTRREADVKTTFKVWWEGKDHLVFKIRCEEPDMANLYTSKQVWGADCVTLLIEPPGHAYYHIDVNADGDIFDVDRFVSKSFSRWESQAVVKTNRGADFWEVEIRLQVVTAAQAESDPNHLMAGEKPTKDKPWFFNVGRTRVRNELTKTYMFSPTRSPSFHVPTVFQKLVVQD